MVPCALVMFSLAVHAAGLRRKIKESTPTGTCGRQRSQAGFSSAAELGTSILNGDAAPKGAWPWVVGLYDGEGAWPMKLDCHGVLLAPEWVLIRQTSKCIPVFFVKNIYAQIGAWNLSATEDLQRIKVDRFFLHPRKNAEDSSMAVLHLERPVTPQPSIDTVCLPRQDEMVPAGSRCVVVGWGALGPTEGKAELPDVLQEASLETKSLQQCRDDYKFGLFSPFRKWDDGFCAVGKTRDGRRVDTCQGDASAPLLCEVNGRWTVQGLGIDDIDNGECSTPDRPPIFARVDLAADWIQRTMDEGPDKCPADCKRRCKFLDSCTLQRCPQC